MSNAFITHHHAAVASHYNSRIIAGALTAVSFFTGPQGWSHNGGTPTRSLLSPVRRIGRSDVSG